MVAKAFLDITDFLRIIKLFHTNSILQADDEDECYLVIDEDLEFTGSEDPVPIGDIIFTIEARAKRNPKLMTRQLVTSGGYSITNIYMDDYIIFVTAE